MHGAIKERLQYLTIPKDLSDWQLGAYFTFTQHDIDIIQRYRRDYKPTRICSTSMCAAVFGRRYPDVKIIPESILQYEQNKSRLILKNTIVIHRGKLQSINN